MDPAITAPPYDQLHRTAEQVARERPEVEAEMAREIFLEVATLLHNGLVLDALDVDDASAVVAGLCVDLTADEPGNAIRERSRRIQESPPGDLHDPATVAEVYLVTAALLGL